MKFAQNSIFYGNISFFTIKMEIIVNKILNVIKNENVTTGETMKM